MEKQLFLRETALGKSLKKCPVYTDYFINGFEDFEVTVEIGSDGERKLKHTVFESAISFEDEIPNELKEKMEDLTRFVVFIKDAKYIDKITNEELVFENNFMGKCSLEILKDMRMIEREPFENFTFKQDSLDKVKENIVRCVNCEIYAIKKLGDVVRSIKNFSVAPLIEITSNLWSVNREVFKNLEEAEERVKNK